MNLPFPPLEVGVVQPALIDIDDPLALRQQFYELFGEHLPQHQALLRVGIVRDPLYPFILEPKILPKNCGDELRSYVQLMVLLHELHDFRSIIDNDICIEQLSS